MMRVLKVLRIKAFKIQVLPYFKYSSAAPNLVLSKYLVIINLVLKLLHCSVGANNYVLYIKIIAW